MELSIDTVGEQSGVAVSERGRVLTEISWQSGRRHTPSLTPMIDLVCRQTGNAEIVKQELEAVFVDVGPGAYGGIRSGMAAAAGLAVALDLQCVGVGRLEIEAYQHASSGLAAAIHRASRTTWAWQIFWGPLDRWRELEPARTGGDVRTATRIGRRQTIRRSLRRDLRRTGTTGRGDGVSAQRRGLAVFAAIAECASGRRPGGTRMAPAAGRSGRTAGGAGAPLSARAGDRTATPAVNPLSV